MPPKSSMWDHKADKDLLLAIIEEGALKSIIWPAIASKMNAKGYSFTHEACRQHFQKIRKESKSASGSSPSTPAKPQPKVRAPKGNTKAALANSHSSMDEYSSGSGKRYFGDEEDEEESARSSVKRKRGGFGAGEGSGFKNEGMGVGMGDMNGGVKKDEDEEKEKGYLFKMEHGADMKVGKKEEEDEKRKVWNLDDDDMYI